MSARLTVSLILLALACVVGRASADDDRSDAQKTHETEASNQYAEHTDVEKQIDDEAWRSAMAADYVRWQDHEADLATRLAELKAKTAAMAAVPDKADPRWNAPVAAGSAAVRYPDLIAWAEVAKPYDNTTLNRVFGYSHDPLAVMVDNARKRVADVVEEEPANSLANFDLGDILLRQGHIEDAAVFLDRAALLAGMANDGELARKARAEMRGLPAPPRPDPEVARPPVVWRLVDAPKEIWDAPEAPKMVVVPGGAFNMGERDAQHRVRIVRPFAVSRYPITFREYDACVSDGACTDLMTDQSRCSPNCGVAGSADALTGVDLLGLLEHGVPPAALAAHEAACGFTKPTPPTSHWDQRGRFPVYAVGPASASFADRYVAWLSRKTGHRYRLLSESEWEYAARAGTESEFYFGEVASPCQANYDGHRRFPQRTETDGFRVGRLTPVGRFAPNAFGLFDMAGGVRVSTADCWHETYDGAPTDGSAWATGECDRHPLRGGDLFSPPWELRSASRFSLRANSFQWTFNPPIVGIRVARDL